MGTEILHFSNLFGNDAGAGPWRTLAAAGVQDSAVAKCTPIPKLCGCVYGWVWVCFKFSAPG